MTDKQSLVTLPGANVVILGSDPPKGASTGAAGKQVNEGDAFAFSERILISSGLTSKQDLPITVKKSGSHKPFISTSRM